VPSAPPSPGPEAVVYLQERSASSEGNITSSTSSNLPMKLATRRDRLDLLREGRAPEAVGQLLVVGLPHTETPASRRSSGRTASGWARRNAVESDGSMTLSRYRVPYEPHRRASRVRGVS